MVSSCDDAAFDLARDVLALGCDGVKFVDEDDRRRLLGGVLEDLLSCCSDSP